MNFFSWLILIAGLLVIAFKYREHSGVYSYRLERLKDTKSVEDIDSSYQVIANKIEEKHRTRDKAKLLYYRKLAAIAALFLLGSVLVFSYEILPGWL